MPLTPLERKAAFAHAVTMHETTKTAGALELGYSYTHVEGVMEGSRPGSEAMKRAVATYCGVPYDEFWGADAPVAAAS